MSEMLTQQGSRGGPSNSWQETMGRIAQQLAGAYIGYKDQKNQNAANQAFSKVEPDSFSPTYSPAETQEFMKNATGGMSRGLRGSDIAEERLNAGQFPRMNTPIPTAPPTDDQLMEREGIKGIMDKISRFNGGMSGDPVGSASYDQNGDQALNDGVDLQAQKYRQAMEQGRAETNPPIPGNQMPDFSGLHQINSEANIPRPNPAQQTANLMAGNQTMNEKKPQLEYAMQNLRGMENNPYAQRLLQGLMMNQMDTNAASRLAGTARDQKLADDARSRGFAVEDATRDRGYAVEDRDLLAQNKVDVKEAGLGTGPFRGTGMPAQYSNILLNGDPNSPVYRAAYNEMATSKNTIDPNTGQMVSVSPDMSAFRPPTGAPINTAPQGRTPGQPSVSVTEGKGRTKPYPEFQSKSAGFYNRMMDANSEIDNLFAGKDGELGTPDDLKTGDVYNWREYASDNVPFIGNALTSDNFQRAQQAQRNWVSANLRLESGAAIPPEEMEMEFKKYFPSYGDGDAVIKQKARARKKVEQNMVTQSQGAYESMYGAGKKNPPSDAPQPPSGFKVVN
jgi:hypothetical protein